MSPLGKIKFCGSLVLFQILSPMSCAMFIAWKNGCLHLDVSKCREPLL